jgi:hypothetical protein
MKARRVLADCELALERADVAVAPEDFRVSWAALVALLRAVGHVLDKVDRQESSALDRAISARWKLWHDDRQSHAMFWRFIEEERNNVLKAYEFGYLEEDVEIQEVRADSTSVIYPNVPLFSSLRTGPFSGQPGLDVARRAIAWWAQELDAIENAAHRYGA